jgi:hypothetical protein
MSVGPLGIFGSVAATPAAQRAADNERIEQEAARQQGEIKNDAAAEKAAGIGETDGDEHGTNERDADGRRLWEIGPRDKKKANSAEPPAPTAIRQSKDVSGTTGGQLDLTG